MTEGRHPGSSCHTFRFNHDPTADTLPHSTLPYPVLSYLTLPTLPYSSRPPYFILRYLVLQPYFLSLPMSPTRVATGKRNSWYLFSQGCPSAHVLTNDITCWPLWDLWGVVPGRRISCPVGVMRSGCRRLFFIPLHGRLHSSRDSRLWFTFFSFNVLLSRLYHSK